jgi:hypothetical protein
MFIASIISEAPKPKVGRPFQHIEDLVFMEGSAGAKRSLARLQDVAKGVKLRYKWDGKPQVYWGREPNGQFIMCGHNGWLSKDLAGKSQSARGLAGFIMGTGKAATDDEISARQAFATEFASLWPLFEAATPRDFRGYVYGDLLYLRRPEITEGRYVFTPNKVSYSVPAKSQLGARIAQSTAAVVGHAFFPEFGMPDESQQPISDFSQFAGNSNLVVMGATYVEQMPSVDAAKLKQIEQYVNANAAVIDAFTNDEQLAALKMTGFKSDVLYRFNNQMAGSGQLSGLANKFIQWVQTSKTSDVMKQKIADWVQRNQKGFVATFAVLENIRQVKDHIIQQSDTQGEIAQQTGDQPGGEGYVMYHPTGNVKFVPRHRWTPTR